MMTFEIWSKCQYGVNETISTDCQFPNMLVIWHKINYRFMSSDQKCNCRIKKITKEFHLSVDRKGQSKIYICFQDVRPFLYISLLQ